ncbi:DNA/RNA non-specific endonuclease [Pseudomonas sp.]|uniref:DNA/RNA non-specific endonuclease n=1 Tax=Pseudomonas sp. TaxID=306 RepID=UPI0025E34718|nr:DNA/RNA non-specific endonuclease [Pseudomonas sp.]
MPRGLLRGVIAAAVLVVAGCGGGGGDSMGATGQATSTAATPRTPSSAVAPSTSASVEATPATPSSACPQHYALVTPPSVTREGLRPLTRELCYDTFAVLHSGVSRTPLYAAEHLTRANLALASMLERIDSFHAETALPAEERAELNDYARSGYDRGHMAPNADMPTPTAQAQSFSLANMVPQVHANNAGIWSGMEQVARRLATGDGEVYVVSGPAFLGTEIKQVGRVLVPTHLWKVIYRPYTQQAGAYVIRNDDSAAYQVVSITALAQSVGIDVLPSLPAVVRETALELPQPTSGATRVTQWP